MHVHNQDRLARVPGLGEGIQVSKVEAGVAVGKTKVRTGIEMCIRDRVEKIKFISPEIGVVAFHIRIVSDMPSACRGLREQIRAQRALVGRAISPKGSSRLPIHAQAFVMSHCVLNDESFHALRVRQDHAKTHRPAIVPVSYTHLDVYKRQESRRTQIPVWADFTRHGAQIVPKIDDRRTPPEPVAVIPVSYTHLTAYSLRHTYISMRLMEGANIYQIAKNCRTSVGMIEKYYGVHIKNSLNAAAINVVRSGKDEMAEEEI